jgi:hypothetical protein
MSSQSDEDKQTMLQVEKCQELITIISQGMNYGNRSITEFLTVQLEHHPNSITEGMSGISQ